ncbi:MAG: hypothetical protein KAI53_01975 [Candidatus Aenigmarchaeota archaeon]|nr:hypothetical protein [Candidatus Aenigmarchaeota archaeon]
MVIKTKLDLLSTRLSNLYAQVLNTEPDNIEKINGYIKEVEYIKQNLRKTNPEYINTFEIIPELGVLGRVFLHTNFKENPKKVKERMLAQIERLMNYAQNPFQESSLTVSNKKMLCFKSNAICPKSIESKSNYVFIGMPFSKKHELVYKYGIKPVLEKLGKEAQKADEKKGNIDVMCKVCYLIQISDFAIINISEWNPNVLFELGLIYGLGKKAILIKSDEEKEEKADLKGIEYIKYVAFNSDCVYELENNEKIKNHFKGFAKDLEDCLRTIA